MQQRLCLAHALVHDPPVLLLDEPASGLDPRARIELRELIRELRDMGKTVVISSHILPELEELCTRSPSSTTDGCWPRARRDIERQLRRGAVLRVTVAGGAEARGRGRACARGEQSVTSAATLSDGRSRSGAPG